MDELAFRKYLRREGRTEKVADEVVTLVRRYEAFLRAERGGKALEAAGPDDLDAFVAQIEASPKASAKSYLWAICYFYACVGDHEMREVAGALREARIERTPFPLRDFRGVQAEPIERLAAAGIRNVKQMLAAGYE